MSFQKKIFTAILWDGIVAVDGRQGDILSAPVTNFALPHLSQAVPWAKMFSVLGESFIAKIPWPGNLDMIT